MIITVSDAPSATCLEQLDAIERAADELFRARDMTFADPSTAAAFDQQPGYYLIATDEESRVPVGFAQIITEGRFAHLEQLSVHPGQARRGYGRALVAAAIAETEDRGYAALTLRTYDEIPWNRPFYESCGFSTIDDPAGPFFERIIASEESYGLPQHGRRVFMRFRISDSEA